VLRSTAVRSGVIYFLVHFSFHIFSQTLCRFFTCLFSPFSFVVSKRLTLWTFLLRSDSLVPFALWRKHILLYPAVFPPVTAFIRHSSQSGLVQMALWRRIGNLFLVLGAPVFSSWLDRQPTRKVDYWLWGIGILSTSCHRVVCSAHYYRHHYAFICIFLPRCLSTHEPTRSTTPVPHPFYDLLSCCYHCPSWYDIKGYYQINNPTIIVAVKIDSTPKCQSIAPYDVTPLFYQTHRPVASSMI